MNVYLDYLHSLADAESRIINNRGQRYYYDIDIRLSTLVYIAITRYNIPTDKLPKSLIRDDATIKAVVIHSGCITYYEKFSRSCDNDHHLHSFEPYAYNTRILNYHNPYGTIPPSVVCIITDTLVHLTPAVKYLSINGMHHDEFHINTELEYLQISGIIQTPITTTKHIKILHIDSVRNIDKIMGLFAYTKHIIYSELSSYDKHMIDDTLNFILSIFNGETILVPRSYGIFKSEKIISL